MYIYVWCIISIRSVHELYIRHGSDKTQQKHKNKQNKQTHKNNSKNKQTQKTKTQNGILDFWIWDFGFGDFGFLDLWMFVCFLLLLLLLSCVFVVCCVVLFVYIYIYLYIYIYVRRSKETYDHMLSKYMTFKFRRGFGQIHVVVLLFVVFVFFCPSIFTSLRRITHLGMSTSLLRVTQY